MRSVPSTSVIISETCEGVGRIGDDMSGVADLVRSVTFTRLISSEL